MAAFPHAHDHHPPGHLQHALHRLGKAIVQTPGQRLQGGRLDVEGFPRQAQRLGRVEGALRADRCLHGQDSIDRRLIKPGDVG